MNKNKKSSIESDNNDDHIIKIHKCHFKKDKRVHKHTLASSHKQGISSSPDIKFKCKNEKHNYNLHHIKTRSKTKVNETKYNYNYNYKSKNYISQQLIDKLIGKHKEKDMVLNFIKIAFSQSKYFYKFSDKDVETISELFDVFYLDSDYVAFPIGYVTTKKIVILIDGNLIKNKTKELYGIRNRILFEDDLYKNNKEQINYSLLPYPDVLFLEADVNEILKLFNVNTLNDIISRNEIIETLSKVPLFKNLPENKLRKIASSTFIQKFKDEQLIIKQGDKGDKFYIVKSGSVKITVNGNYIRTLNPKDFFGERALLTNEIRTASVISIGKTSLYCLSKNNFFENIEKNMQDFLKHRLALQDDKVEINDFIFIKELGIGNYGSVSLVISKKNNYKYAIKSICLKHINYEKLHHNLSLEKAILLQIDHPFIVKLVKCMKDEFNIYFLMEYLKGKELFDVIRDIGLLNKEQAQFYSGSIMIAIHYLHKRKFIYRDIKPENIIITPTGYIKLIDFGTAKELKHDKTNTIIGTPHYMAPEVILGEGYSFQVDYWSIAVCLFEFVCGEVPFGETSEDPMEIYLSIINNHLLFPQHCKDKAFKDLMKSMLNKTLSLRLNHLDEIKRHLWFKNFDWDELLSMTMEPPYYPNINETNVSQGIEYKSYIMEQTKKWEDNEVNVIYTPKQLKEFEMWYNDFC